MVPEDAVNILVAGYQYLFSEDAVVDRVSLAELAIDRIGVRDEPGSERPPRYAASQSLFGQPRMDVCRADRRRNRLLQRHYVLFRFLVRWATSAPRPRLRPATRVHESTATRSGTTRTTLHSPCSTALARWRCLSEAQSAESTRAGALNGPALTLTQSCEPSGHNQDGRLLEDHRQRRCRDATCSHTQR